MSLIDSSYSIFTSGNYNLLTRNLDSDQLNYTCQEVEDKILKLLFGDVMHLDFEQKLTDDDYLELINGYKVNDELAPYELQSKKYVYRGLKDMLAYFTYFYFIQNQFRYNPNAQEAANEIEVVNPASNALRAYNQGVKLYNDAYRFLVYKQSNDSTIFTDWEFTSIDE